MPSKAVAWRFRKAALADAAAISELVQSAYRGESSKAGWTTEADFLEGRRTDIDDVCAIIRAPGQQIVICTNKTGQLLASAQLEIDGALCHFGMFAVQPVLQGAGLGKAMLAHCEKRALQAGCTRMEMWVIWLRDSLIEFYERRGYIRTAQTQPFPYGDARFGAPLRSDLHFIVIEKQLRPGEIATGESATGESAPAEIQSAPEQALTEAEILAGLLASVAAGSHAALGTLYEMSVDRVHGVVARIVRHEADADDVMCEVYRHVWERPQQYSNERGPVLAWLMVIARSRAIDWVRKRRTMLNFDTTPFNEIDPSALVEVTQAPDLLEALQTNSIVRDALKELSADQRKMIELAFFKDLSHFEIAELTDMALGTVKSHIRRGQEKLKQALIARGITP